MTIKGMAIIPKKEYPKLKSKLSNGIDTNIKLKAMRLVKMTCLARCVSLISEIPIQEKWLNNDCIPKIIARIVAPPNSRLKYIKSTS